MLVNFVSKPIDDFSWNEKLRIFFISDMFVQKKKTNSLPPGFQWLNHLFAVYIDMVQINYVSSQNKTGVL